MTFSKRDRESAATRCALLADHWARSCAGPYAYDFQPPGKCWKLSTEAFCEAAIDRSLSIAETWAEAEALIRSGWSPT